jgi:hypothetical protein
MWLDDTRPAERGLIRPILASEQLEMPQKPGEIPRTPTRERSGEHVAGRPLLCATSVLHVMGTLERVAKTNCTNVPARSFPIFDVMSRDHRRLYLGFIADRLTHSEELAS